MKLWLLERDMFQAAMVIYDANNGFVIRAETEQHAREIASEQPGDEGRATWLDPRRSKCRELTADGPQEVVLRDFNAG
jgi:hypothetical protein